MADTVSQLQLGIWMDRGLEHHPFDADADYDTFRLQIVSTGNSLKAQYPIL
jgi:hypothetical protein